MKKKIALLLTLTVVAGTMAACGSSSSTASTSTADTASVAADSAAATEDAAPAEGTVTISFFDKNSGTRTFDDPIAQELEKRTGVSLELVSPTGDPGEKLSLMLAAQDYPDIVLMDRSSDIVNQYIEAGALVPISDYLDKLPNVVKMYGDVLNKSRYTDGKNYYLNNWYGYDPDPVNCALIRYDYLVDLVGQERADSDEPFTMSEFTDLLKQFKEKYPEVDGAAAMPLSMGEPSDGSINGTILGAFGMYPMYVDDDGVHFQWNDPQFLDAVHALNNFYTEGLLDPEWTSNSSELRNQKMAANNAFAYFGAYWDLTTPSQTLEASENENAEYLPYMVIADGMDPADNTLSGRSSLGWDAIGITTNCENLDAALAFVDYCASQEGQDLLLWGIEGDSYEFVDGVRTPIGDIVDRWRADSANVTNETGICKWTWFVYNGTHEDDGTTCRIWYNEKDRSNTYAYQNLNKYSGYYDTAEFAGLQPAGNSTDALKYQKIIDLFNQSYPNMVNAASTEECDAVYNQMIADMDAAGVADVEAYMTGIYNDRMELWGMEPLNKR